MPGHVCKAGNRTPRIIIIIIIIAEIFGQVVPQTWASHTKRSLAERVAAWYVCCTFVETNKFLMLKQLNIITGPVKGPTGHYLDFWSRETVLLTGTVYKCLMLNMSTLVFV